MQKVQIPENVMVGLKFRATSCSGGHNGVRAELRIEYNCDVIGLHANTSLELLFHLCNKRESKAWRERERERDASEQQEQQQSSNDPYIPYLHDFFEVI